jgi:signal transduction histidine kinase
VRVDSTDHPAPHSAVLLVDDRKENLLALTAIFADTGVETVAASSGEEALRKLLAGDFACVVLDVVMPGMDGFEVASLIKQRERTRHVPILFLTASMLETPALSQKAYGVGAVDYLMKPVDPELLRAKVNVFVELHRRQVEIERQAKLLKAAGEERQKRILIEAERQSEELARKAAEEALRLREEFLTVAAHEFRTPLTSLRLAVQQLKREQSAPPLQLELIERQANRLNRLLEQLVEAADAGSSSIELELQDVDLAAVVRSAAAAAEPEAARAGCRLDVVIECAARGRFDDGRLQRVIAHLLANAIRFGAGKPIVLALGCEKAGVQIRVRDRGIGIDPQQLGRIFGRFERAVPARAYGGFGLGLHVSRRVVEAHGGTLTAENQHGGGSVFTILLPLRPAAPSP